MTKFIQTNLGSSKSLTPSNYQATQPYSTEVEPTTKAKLSQQGIVAPWGKTNKFPKELDDKTALSLDLEAGYQTLTELCYGLGIETYFEEKDENGISKRTLVYYEEFEKFREMYNFDELYLQKAYYNYFRYANVFIEFAFDSNGKINRLFTKDSPYCRISNMDKKTGLSQWLFQSAEWDQSNFNIDNNKTKTELISEGLLSQIPLIDYRNPIDFIKSRSKNILLGWHIKDYSPGNPYYGQSPWYPILDNGWLEIAAKAPSMLKSYYEHLITIAHHIEINIGYLEATVINWAGMDGDQRKKHIEELQTDIDNNITGADKAYKSLFSQFRMLPNGQIESMYKIHDIQNPTKDSTILKDLEFANTIVQSALRLDSSITGNKADGSKEADSGSEKRVASNIISQRNKMIRDQILYPLTILKHVNEWDPRLRFGIKTEQLVTTDINPTGKI